MPVLHSQSLRGTEGESDAASGSDGREPPRWMGRKPPPCNTRRACRVAGEPGRSSVRQGLLATGHTQVHYDSIGAGLGTAAENMPASSRVHVEVQVVQPEDLR